MFMAAGAVHVLVLLAIASMVLHLVRIQKRMT